MIGAGGHAGVLIEILLNQGREIHAIVSPQLGASSIFKKFTHIDDDHYILNLDKDNIELVNGIGSLPNSNLRHQIYDKYKQAGFTFSQVISSKASISPYSQLEEGCQVMPFALVQHSTHIGANSIINSHATIEHDCKISANVHIAPGVTISGNVQIGYNTHIGTGASIINNIHIGEYSVIGAGSVVTKDIPEKSILYPAKPFLKCHDSSNKS